MEEKIKSICDKCKNEFEISKRSFKRREKLNLPNYCNSCMREFRSNREKERWSNKSKEEMNAYSELQKRIWENKSDNEKQKWSQRTKDQLSKRTPEEWKEINKKNSEGLKKHWETVSEEDKKQRVTPMQNKSKEYLRSLSDEERRELAFHKIFDNMSEETLKKFKENSKNRMIEYNNSLSYDEKIKRVNMMNKKNREKSKEERNEIYKRSHQWYFNLSDEDKLKYSNSKREYFNNLSPEERADKIKRALSSSNSKNNFHKKFENYFNSSHLKNDFYLSSEIVMVFENNVHSWDYGIFNKDNKLVAVVDLDGMYYHADNKHEYDGFHSNEEYDERRSLSVDPNLDIKIFIIQESNFTKTFEYIIKELFKKYNEYINDTFKYLRSMPFPYPEYDKHELIHSYNKLITMKCDDKYHKDISLNTRIGDHLIYHFHKSIYHAHRKGELSPYDAWYDDKLLIEVIKNRIIYQSYLNPNKILQGFNISKIAQKVSVFSAGRAKLLIYKYLNEYDEIFDPFSGFSGRMLGTVSLGKKYIGQDLSEIHISESNKLIEFLYRYFNFDTNILCKDVLKSSGTYECLFTCPPYNDIEIWEDVNPINKSCDEWIDICLNNFKCKKYLFVVDNTEKYKDFIVDEIINKSHMNQNKEYIILIKK